MVDDSAALLEHYLRERSEQAFAEIVRRYVDLVYASARRQVRDADLANDVTQAVFLVLAQKAGSVSTDRPLSAWLLRTTTYCAANAQQAREHRQFHERKAAEMARDTNQPTDDQAEWEQLAPLLDEGLNKLGAGERDAVILKYFEKKSLRQVGEMLGISEEAATKRVSRAIERLRIFFQKRGTAVSGVALASLLASESAKAAPAGLAGTISTGAGTSAAAGTGAASVAKGAMLLMATQKAKAAAAAAALLLGIGGVLALKMSTNATRRHAANIPVKPVLPPSMIKTRWALTFSDATVVEIMGICDPDAQTPQWWALDGSTALAPDGATTNLGSNAGQVDLPAGQTHRQIVLRMTGPGTKDHELALRLAPSVTSTRSTNRTGRDMTATYTLAIPVNTPTASFNLGIARGAWTVEETLNVDSSVPQKAPVAPRLLKAYGNGAQTLVDASINSKNNLRPQERVIAELKDGKEVDCQKTSIGAGAMTYYFDCPQSSVARIVRSSRPYEWATVTNASLIPTVQPTDVKIERLPTSALTQATP